MGSEVLCPAVRTVVVRGSGRRGGGAEVKRSRERIENAQLNKRPTAEGRAIWIKRAMERSHPAAQSPGVLPPTH